MIETLLIDYLSEHLEVFVGMEAPEQTTDYVLVDKTGSSRNNHIITSSFAIQSYGATLYDAMLLNQEVTEVMEGLIELDQITRVELETDYNFTNTATKQYRWQAVYSITHY
jgi:hypothetical protein